MGRGNWGFCEMREVSSYNSKGAELLRRGGLHGILQVRNPKIQGALKRSRIQGWDHHKFK